MSDPNDRKPGPDDSDEAPEARQSSEPRPRKSRMRRRKSSRPQRAEQQVSALDAMGRERPAFLLRFEGNTELQPIIAAYELGDYATVRRLAKDLLRSAKRRELHDAAHEFLERIRPDPLIKYLLLASIALLMFLILFVYRNPVH